MIDTNFIGSFLLHLAIVVCVFSTVSSIVGRIRSDGRLLIAGERGGYAGEHARGGRLRGA